MKIFSASQIRACDAYTIHASHIRSIDLMERAANTCAEWIAGQFTKENIFVILCGTGNNGGDGLALARLLHRMGYGVKAFQLLLSNELSPDCTTNLERLKATEPTLVETVMPDTYVTDIPANVIIIDAIFGTGLNRPIEGWVANFIRHINHLPNYRIAIDIPSGMPADTIAPEDTAIIKANETLSFQFYKRSFLHPETGRLAGRVHILDIGLNQTFIQATHTNYRIIDRSSIMEFYKPREPFTHKGTYGTALLIGGSYGMMGAISLSVRGALRTGTGRVKSLVPQCGYSIIQTLAPEAMCQTSGEEYLKKVKEWEDIDAVGIGPGMGNKGETQTAFEEFLDAFKEPLVIDADALNMIGKKKKLLHKIPSNSILTPHPGEFERIFGTTANSMLRLEHARTQAMRYNIVIVMKDHYTEIVTPEGECWYNVTGNAGMATGGSGDVLTGIITSLLAQKYEPVHAALMGVYLHGIAGDLALERQSVESLIAGDIVDYIGKAYKAMNK